LPIGLSKYGTPAAFSSSRSDSCSAKSSPDHSNTKLPSEEESSEGTLAVASTSSISQSLHRVIPGRNSALHDGQNISRWSLLHHGAPADAFSSRFETPCSASHAASVANFSSCDQGAPSGRPSSVTRCRRAADFIRNACPARSKSSRSLTVHIASPERTLA